MKQILLLFLFVTTHAVAQEQDTVELIPQQPNILCLDEQTKFPGDLSEANDFELVFYNRWGEILGKCADKNSYLQEALVNYKPSQEFEVVVFQIKFTTYQGEEKEYYGHMYLTAYCECG
jgi:hypothetical protein